MLQMLHPILLKFDPRISLFPNLSSFNNSFVSSKVNSGYGYTIVVTIDTEPNSSAVIIASQPTLIIIPVAMKYSKLVFGTLIIFLWFVNTMYTRKKIRLAVALTCALRYGSGSICSPALLIMFDNV